MTGGENLRSWGELLATLAALVALVAFGTLFGAAKIWTALKLSGEGAKAGGSRRGSGKAADLRGSHKKQRPSSHSGQGVR